MRLAAPARVAYLSVAFAVTFPLVPAGCGPGKTEAAGRVAEDPHRNDNIVKAMEEYNKQHPTSKP